MSASARVKPTAEKVRRPGGDNTESWYALAAEMVEFGLAATVVASGRVLRSPARATRPPYSANIAAARPTSKPVAGLLDGERQGGPGVWRL